MSGPHGENPTAITDPTQMAEAWAKITDLSEKLQALAPNALKKDATMMVDGVIAMNTIFKANKYDLLAIAKKPTVRDALTKLIRPRYHRSIIALQYVPYAKLRRVTSYFACAATNRVTPMQYIHE